MALIKCRECGNEVSTTASNCPKCGAKVKKPTSLVTKLVLGLIGLGVLSSIISGMSRNPPPGPSSIATGASPAVKATVTAPVVPPAPPMSAASTVAAGDALLKRWREREAWAKAQLAGKTLPEPAGAMVRKDEWSGMRTQLSAIAPSAPEYKRAQAVLKGMDEEDKKAAAFAAAELEKAKVTARKDYAKALEQSLIDKRMNVDVTASGPNNTTLTIKYVLANKVIVNDMQKSGIVEQAFEKGFKQVRLTDGYDSSWTWKND